ncbi:MAG TPA: dihydrofolate reductase, partial [Candidatus Methylomirabilis sp.]|nr:dihydrofolate reductase [Candidatus Methylomirabilis sp.]
KGDMKHFVQTTRGHTVVMGQKTYEGLFVKPLPNRKNIVLTLDKNFQAPGCEIFYSLEDFLAAYKNAAEEIFIIGGASIYKQFISLAEKLYLTLVDDTPLADVFFPDFSAFKIFSEGETQEENGVKYKFVEFVRN